MAPRSFIASVIALASGSFVSAQDKVDFESQVWPILEKSCVECHKAPYKDDRGRMRNPKAGLRLDGAGWITSGSRTEKVVVPGDGDASLLYILITLDPSEDGFMPRKKAPLTKGQTDVFKRWIDEGAQFGQWVGSGGPKPVVTTETPVEVSIPIAMSPIVALGEGLDPLQSSVVAKAVGKNGNAVPATKDGPLLRVTYFSNQDQVTDQDVNGLLAIRGRVTQLLLGRTGVTDRALNAIGAMSRLTKLDLAKTKITDRGLKSLSKLGELRSLNLYGTKVTDRGLEHLAALKNLERLYVWETKVTEAGVEKLRQALPEAKIIRVLVIPPPQRDGDNENRGRRRGKKK